MQEPLKELGKTEGAGKTYKEIEITSERERVRPLRELREPWREVRL